MTKIRGFKLGKRLIRFSRCIFRKIRIRIRPGYYPLGQSHPSKPIMKLLRWGRKLKSSAKSLLKPGSDYVQLGSDPDTKVPKGYLAVYVGQKDGEFKRVLVPVIYFNHPLFGELLREAEEEYGFEHPGGITIPCRVTKFERVKTQIASGSSNWSIRRFAVYFR